MGNKDIFANLNSVPDNEKFGEVKPHKIRVFGLQEYNLRPVYDQKRTCSKSSGLPAVNVRSPDVSNDSITVLIQKLCYFLPITTKTY